MNTEMEAVYEPSNLVLTNLLNTFPGNVYWLNLKGVVIGCNKRQLISLGLTSKIDIIGKSLEDLLPKLEASQLMNIQNEVIKKDKTITIEEELTFQGKKTYFLSQKSPMKNSHGEIIGLIGFSVDITQQKLHSDKSIKASQREAEIIKGIQSVLFESLSHDLRTPLHSLGLMLDALLDEIKDTQHLKILKCMKLSLNRLSAHCQSLYEGCRTHRISQKVLVNEPLDLQYICDEIISMHQICALDKGIEIIGQYDNMPMLLGDNERIKKILLHLLSNAIKFTQTGGVSIRVKLYPQDNHNVTVKIRVKDTGIGISENIRSAIFEDFATEQPVFLTQHQGLGLGLSTVKKLISELKGEIKVDSEKEKGSTFTVYLPLKLSMENSC